MATTVKEVKLQQNGSMISPVVMVDSVKNLDGTKYSAHTHAWSAITGKPSTFTPASHTHSEINYHTGNTLTQTIDAGNSGSFSMSFTKPITLTIEKGQINYYSITLKGSHTNSINYSYSLTLTLPSSGTFLIYDGSNYTKKSANTVLKTISGKTTDGTTTHTLTWGGYICRLT